MSLPLRRIAAGAARRRLTPGQYRTLFTSQSSSASSSPLRTGLYATGLLVSAGVLAVYYSDSRSAIHRYVVTPALRKIVDAETGHKIAVKALAHGLGPKDVVPDDERLGAQLWGEHIKNPIGLAAGFDKDGEAVDGLLDLGFSWVEIGSVTPKPQPGNPTPRVFHLPEDEALINRYGFPSQGHISVVSRLRARIPLFFNPLDNENASLRPQSILAINLGKNKASPAESIDDFVTGVRTLGPFADVLVVNVSSPNTPGLRGLQSRKLLEELLAGVTRARDELIPAHIAARKPKIVLKIAPDLDENALADVADAIKHSSVDAVIVANTTTQRPASLVSENRTEIGGLSGPPLKPLALQALRTLRAQLPASIPLIGCGGISSGADALEYARAGTSLVQVYTAFGYDGAGFCRRVKDELTVLLEKENTTWSAVVDKAVTELSEKKEKATLTKLIQEAEELKKLLDGFGDKLDSSAAAAASEETKLADSAAAAVPPVAP